MSARPKSIEQIGLDTYLSETAESHNGFNYDDFKKMVESGVNVSNIARAFNVGRLTATKWLKVYLKEQEMEV